MDRIQSDADGEEDDGDHVADDGNHGNGGLVEREVVETKIERHLGAFADRIEK